MTSPLVSNFKAAGVAGALPSRPPSPTFTDTRGIPVDFCRGRCFPSTTGSISHALVNARDRVDAGRCSPVLDARDRADAGRCASVLNARNRADALPFSMLAPGTMLGDAPPCSMPATGPMLGDAPSSSIAAAVLLPGDAPPSSLPSRVLLPVGTSLIRFGVYAPGPPGAPKRTGRTGRPAGYRVENGEVDVRVGLSLLGLSGRVQSGHEIVQSVQGADCVGHLLP